MTEHTFFRVGKGINDFVKKILDANPDYIVPVKKKGCKLLKYVKVFSKELSEKVRYKDYFENNDIDLKGLKISVVDDATKYTSMLCKYRTYFEDKGAVVDTYSYVGHDRLRSGEREQYDSKAYIQTYLEESTYQEYLNQQSRALVNSINFFDIDHFVIKFTVSNKKYEQLLGSLGKIGEIELVNDLYTPKNIEKLSIVNMDFYGAETLVEFPGRGIGNQFILGDIKAFDGGTHRIALARTSGDGNNKAAIRAAKMLEHFPKLEVILMVGIAGGTPVLPNLYGDDISNHLDKHVRLGDVVVSKGIFQYDYVKEKKGSFVFKGENIPPCAKVSEAQQRLEEVLERDKDDMLPWNMYVKQALQQLKSNYERPDGSTDQLRDYNGELIEHPTDAERNENYPKIFRGKIASSNTVLKNPEKRDLLKRQHDVYAIEMETSGIADTTWEAGVGYYGVRGICDYCDSYKNDIWHRYAALVAAAYTKALIEWMST